MFRYRQTPIHLQITAVSCKTRRAVLIHSNYRRILYRQYNISFYFTFSDPRICGAK